MKEKWWALAPAAPVFLGDLWLKHISIGQDRTLIPGVLSLRYTLNTGFALGLFPDSALAATLISFLMLLIMLFFLFRFPWRRPAVLGFGMILGGAAGNLWDRLLLRAVRDMLHLDFMHFYVFNLADAAVVLGAGLILLSTLLSREEPA